MMLANTKYKDSKIGFRQQKPPDFDSCQNSTLPPTILGHWEVKLPKQTNTHREEEEEEDGGVL